MQKNKKSGRGPTLFHTTVYHGNHLCIMVPTKKILSSITVFKIDRCIPNDPLRFDQLYCALGSVAIKSGQHYWEVDVHCCPSWAVGVAYGSLQRRGRDKGAKLGRNRCSWSLEFQDGHLTAWHNDRHVALPVTATRAAPNRVGVFVKYQKGRLFSAVQTAVFDRAHHQFTEPLYPAFCFFSSKDKGHHHMEICNLSL
uniref:Si:dkey-219e21.4 n=1 Tax=Sinocyclocheilus anshuiensis TaxID=1608454 RepID=A0A671QLH6_9TELE